MDESILGANDFPEMFDRVSFIAHDNAVNKGWWDEDRSDGEILMLMVSELAEACEWARKGNPASDHIPELSGVEEELADTVIRTMDFAGKRGHRVGEAIVAKMNYNFTRPYKHGGKKF